MHKLLWIALINFILIDGCFGVATLNLYKCLDKAYQELKNAYPSPKKQLSNAYCALPSDSPIQGAVTQKITYGTSHLQYGELTYPIQTGKHPLIIFIHGRCWQNQFGNPNFFAPLANALVKQGIASWNIEFRGTDDIDGGYPNTYLDVAKAADYLKTIANKYQLDLQRTIVIGEDSGAHLGFWLAGRPKIPKNSPLYTPSSLPIYAVIGLGAITDLEAFAPQANEVCGNAVYNRILPDNLHVNDVSPLALLPLQVAQILIFGQQDDVTPQAYSAEYYLAAKSKGDPITIINLPDIKHQDYLSGTAYATLVASVTTLLNQQPTQELNQLCCSIEQLYSTGAR